MISSLALYTCKLKIITGYGNMVNKIKAELEKHITIDSNATLKLLIDMIANANRVNDIGGDIVVFTMWESSVLPNSAKWLKNAKLIIVPSNYNKEIFHNNGLRLVSVVPLGVDTQIYYKKDIEKSVCTFGIAGSFFPRKNFPFIVNAFKKAFVGKEAFLKIKTSPLIDDPKFQYLKEHHPQIQIIARHLAESEMCEWYNSLDAFISCSHSEGFGLHQLEAMACGIPMISPKFGGVTEFFDETVGYCVDYKITDASNYIYNGKWCSAIEESLIDKMMIVYNNRNKAKELGLRARDRATFFTWNHTVSKLINKLNKYVSLNKSLCE
ncbi:D-inositol-3-phosphate glycosyltransferase [uncultured archaeon]|nr:D-inositol-3-phosphate glycosyltransferase [uncultured archaeon]